jgi:hypothetical protein
MSTLKTKVSPDFARYLNSLPYVTVTVETNSIHEDFSQNKMLELVNELERQFEKNQKFYKNLTNSYKSSSSQILHAIDMDVSQKFREIQRLIKNCSDASISGNQGAFKTLAANANTLNNNVSQLLSKYYAIAR